MSSVPKTLLSFIPSHMRQRPIGSPLTEAPSKSPAPSSGYASISNSNEDLVAPSVNHKVAPSTSRRAVPSSPPVDAFSRRDERSFAAYTACLILCLGRLLTPQEADDAFSSYNIRRESQ